MIEDFFLALLLLGITLTSLAISRDKSPSDKATSDPALLANEKEKLSRSGHGVDHESTLIQQQAYGNSSEQEI